MPLTQFTPPIFSQSMADALYIRLDGTSTTTAVIPFALGLTSTGLITGLDGLTITSSSSGRSISAIANTPPGSSGFAGGSITLTAGGNDNNATAAGFISITAGAGDDVASGGAITLTAGNAINVGGNINLTPGSAGNVGNVVQSRGQYQNQTTSSQMLFGTGSNKATLSFPSASNYTITSPSVTTTLAGLAVTQTFTAQQTFSTFDAIFSTNQIDIGSGIGGVTFLKGGSSGSNKTLTLPNTTTTLGGLGTAQTWTASNSFTGSMTIQTLGLTIKDVDITLSTTTGTKFGTLTTHKLSFYNATPIVQPSATTDLRTALINLGLYASGGASPLNLNGGNLTANTGSFSSVTNQLILNSAGTTTTLTANGAVAVPVTITFPASTATLPGLGLTNTFSAQNTFQDLVSITNTTDANGKMLSVAKGYDCTSVFRYAIYSDNYVNISGSGGLTSGYFQSQTAGSGAQTGIVYGINGVAYNNLAGATVSQLTGMNFITYNTGAQQVTLGQGAEVEGRVLGAGNMVTYQGYNSKFLLNTSSGGTTTLTHFNVQAATRSGGTGTITTQYGLFIPDLTSAFVTNAYPIWLDVAGPIYFRATTQRIYSSAANTLDILAPTIDMGSAQSDRVNFIAGNSATAPSTTATPVFTSYYGGNTKELGDPNAWLDVKVNGTAYKIPLYS